MVIKKWILLKVLYLPLLRVDNVIIYTLSTHKMCEGMPEAIKLILTLSLYWFLRFWISLNIEGFVFSNSWILPWNYPITVGALNYTEKKLLHTSQIFKSEYKSSLFNPLGPSSTKSPRNHNTMSKSVHRLGYISSSFQTSAKIRHSVCISHTYPAPVAIWAHLIIIKIWHFKLIIKTNTNLWEPWI